MSIQEDNGSLSSLQLRSLFLLLEQPIHLFDVYLRCLWQKHINTTGYARNYVKNCYNVKYIQKSAYVEAAKPLVFELHHRHFMTWWGERIQDDAKGLWLGAPSSFTRMRLQIKDKP